MRLILARYEYRAGGAGGGAVRGRLEVDYSALGAAGGGLQCS